jgi:hypothetical protein
MLERLKNNEQVDLKELASIILTATILHGARKGYIQSKIDTLSVETKTQLEAIIQRHKSMFETTRRSMLTTTGFESIATPLARTYEEALVEDNEQLKERVSQTSKELVGCR